MRIHTTKRKMAIKESFAGMPYFVEAVAVSHLKRLGLEQISTSASPSKERIKQLRRVELPINRKTGIDIWLCGLGRGINEAAKEAVHNRHASIG